MKEKNNTTTFIIIVMFLFGIVFITVQLWYIGSKEIKDVLAGIGISLLSSALIILISDKIFKNDSTFSTNQKILDILNKMNSNSTVIRDSNEVEKLFDYSDLMSKSNTISMLGYDLMDIFESHSSDLVNAINRGATVNILLVRYTLLTKEIIAQHTNSPDRFQQRYSDALNKIRSIMKQCPKRKINIFETTWPLSYKALFFEGPEKNVARIDLIPFSMKQTYEKHRVLIINKDINKNDFEYFKNCFTYIIKNDSENTSSVFNKNH